VRLPDPMHYPRLPLELQAKQKTTRSFVTHSLKKSPRITNPKPVTKEHTMKMSTNDLALPLKPEQQAQLADINGRLKLLLFTNPEAFARISSSTDAALEAVGASAASLSESAKATCLASAGRFGGQGAVALRAAFDARQKADQAIVAGIPRESMILLKCMHGDNTSKIAEAWRAQQAVTGKARR